MYQDTKRAQIAILLLSKRGDVLVGVAVLCQSSLISDYRNKTETLQWDVVSPIPLLSSHWVTSHSLQEDWELSPSLLEHKSIWTPEGKRQQGRSAESHVPDLEWNPKGGTKPPPLGRDDNGLMLLMAWQGLVMMTIAWKLFIWCISVYRYLVYMKSSHSIFTKKNVQ